MVNSMSKKETDLGRDSIGKLLFKLAMPAIIAQLVNVLYNIVDRMFIGRLQSGYGWSWGSLSNYNDSRCF